MALMRCPKCRTLYNSRDKFCPKCQEPTLMPFKRLWLVVGVLVIVGWAVAALFFKD